MQRKMYTDNPTVNNIIVFNLNTENDDGRIVDPFTLDNVTIFYLEKSVGKNNKVVERKFNNPHLLEQYEKLKETVDGNPSEQVINQIKDLKKKLEETSLTTQIYYKQAQFAMSTGQLWTADGKVRKVVNFVNEKKQVLPGRFFFAWQPKGMREGTYVIRWEWKLKEGGPVKSAEKIFNINADPTEIKSNNINLTPVDKYEFLLRKYMPTMYFVKTKLGDLTPEVLGKVNKAVSHGFNEIENMALKLFTLLDPDTVNNDFLPLLANTVGLTLRSEDTDAWRNQIRHALSLYKAKGTYGGLKKALDKAGVTLLKLTNLWQVVSQYNWTDGFAVDRDINLDTQILGYLTKKPLNTDFEIELKSVGEDYLKLPKEIVSLQEVRAPDAKIAVVWQGGNINPQIPLLKGDVIKIKYQYKAVPKECLALEKYIEESLPLADQRDESAIKFPLKNWNVKLIEEDDPFFHMLVTELNPFVSPVVYGRIRTTFLYSEKVFNMDTYNGSLFNSNNPCDLDKDFIDTCHGGRSSKFNVHLEIENATDEKIKEAKEIIIDYSPFHAMLHNMVINSKITDYVLPPVESIKMDLKENNNKDRVNLGETISCKIKYKDGRVIEGTL